MSDIDAQPHSTRSKPVDPRLLRYAQASRGFFIVIAAISVGQTAAIIAFAWLLARAIVGAIDGMPAADLAATLGALAAVVAARAVLLWARDVVAARAAARVQTQLRTALVSAVGQLGPDWLASRNSAALAITAGRGLEALEAYLGRYLPQLVQTVIATPLIIAVMWWQDWISGLTVLVTLPLIPIFMVLIGMATRAVQQRQWRTLQRLAARFADTVQGLSTLKVFGRQHRAAASIEQVTGEYRRETMKVLRVSFLSGFALEFLASISVAIIAVSIGFRLLDGLLALAVGLFVLLLAPEAYLPLRQVGVQFHAAAEGVAATDDVFEVLDAARVRSVTPRSLRQGQRPEPSESTPEDAVPELRGGTAHRGQAVPELADGSAHPGPAVPELADGSAHRGQAVPELAEGSAHPGPLRQAPRPASHESAPELVLDRLRVHRGDRALAPVTMTSAPGTVTLLQGPSGVGKSSVFAALRGAAEFEGRASFAGQDVRDLAPSTWLAWAGQHPGLIAGSVRENIALGDPSPRAALVDDALALACADDIDPDADLGVQGAGLSGGQAQRVAVARAIYRHRRGYARVIALDEPSSALDADTEARLWGSLRELADAGAGVLLISHRTSARAIADEVVRLETLAVVA